MEKNVWKQIVNEWAGDLPKNQQVIKLFEKVRDIPYGSIGSRDPEDVYKENEGTCSGKHELLKNLYHAIDVETKDFISTHRFKDMSVDFPKHIKDILNRSDIIDPHNFFKIKIEESWFTVDATWDIKLKDLGFIVTENWNGQSDMKVAVLPIDTFEAPSPIEMKKEILSTLPENVQTDRKEFLSELTKWLSIAR